MLVKRWSYFAPRWRPAVTIGLGQEWCQTVGSKEISLEDIACEHVACYGVFRTDIWQGSLEDRAAKVLTRLRWIYKRG